MKVKSIFYREPYQNENKNYRVSRATIQHNRVVIRLCFSSESISLVKTKHYEKSYFDKQHDHIIMTDTGNGEFCDPRIQSIKQTIEEIFDDTNHSY
jgi:Fur family ferric uptake transcriptional regulator